MINLKPIKLTAEDNQLIQSQMKIQTDSTATPKSLDPVNYPVFDIPVNKKKLIYVPNHTMMYQGKESVRMDVPVIHSLEVGSRFLYFRCTNGLKTADGITLDGTCPLCDGTEEPFKLANLLIESSCRAMGIDSEDRSNPSVKNVCREKFGDMAIKRGNQHYTFPIVVFETVNDDAKTIATDENNNIKYKIMWYDISKATYDDKWQSVLEELEDEPTSPAGRFFVLNYTYTPKTGEPNKRDSARNLKVHHRVIENSEELKKALDAQTESWTPEMAQQTVVANQVFSVEQLRQVVDEALIDTRTQLAVILGNQLKSTISIEGTGSSAMQIPVQNGQGMVVPTETDADMPMM